MGGWFFPGVLQIGSLQISAMDPVTPPTLTSNPDTKKQGATATNVEQQGMNTDDILSQVMFTLKSKSMCTNFL